MEFLGFNFVDFIIVILLVFFILEGLGRSVVAEAIDLIAFVSAFIFSLRFYNLAGLFFENNFQVPHSLANILGFITFWFVVETVLFGLIHFLIFRLHFIRRINLDKFNASLIPAFFRGLIFVSIILVLVGTFPIQPKIKQAVLNSKIGSVLLDKTIRLESPLKNVFGGLSQDTLTFLTIKPRTNETVKLGFQVSDFKPNPQIETKMLELVNKERSQKGLKQLKFNNTLRELGRDHSADMFTRGYFSHYSPEGKSVADRVDKAGYEYLVIGENLAYAPDLLIAHQGLMNSEGHRANILSKDYGQIGIGIQDGGVYGLMITQVFSN